MDSHREIRILQALEKIAENLDLIAQILQQKGRNDGRQEARSQEASNED